MAISQNYTGFTYDTKSQPVGETTKIYGQSEYNQALQDYQKMYGTYSSMFNEMSPELKRMLQYYRPGGGYGQGLRTEAEKTVQSGVAKDMGNLVASGMSSNAGARGLNTRAGNELSIMYKGIEDTRNQLWQQSLQPYNQMMQTMGQIEQSRPNYSSYIRPVTTTQYGKTTSATPYSYMG